MPVAAPCVFVFAWVGAAGGRPAHRRAGADLEAVAHAVGRPSAGIWNYATMTSLERPQDRAAEDT